MKKRRSPIGCLFWIALILLAVVIFVFNRARFETALKKTGLENLVTKSAPHRPNAPLGAGKGTSPTNAPLPTQAQKPPGRGGSPSPASPESPAVSSRPIPPVASEGGSARSGSSASAGSSRSGGSANLSSASPKEQRIRQSTLYYFRVSSDGTPVLEPITRDVFFNDSPLTDTLRSLLTALPDKEASTGLVTLIPSGTELLGVTLKNGTAFVDFNDQFRFNSLGAEGFRAELQQVVYTATQFPSVERVQILIGGRIHRFLGPEGMAIDRPLSRSSFGEG